MAMGGKTTSGECEECREKDIPCYHHEVEDHDKIEEYKVEHQRLLNLHPYNFLFIIMNFEKVIHLGA